MAEAKSFNVNGTEIILKDEYARKEIRKTNEQLNNIANEDLVIGEDGKLYIKQADGTEKGTGVELPTGGNVDLSNYVEKVEGKGLSTNDYTTAEKNKLANLSETGFTDEQLSTALQSKIDDGSLSALSVGYQSLTEDKLGFSLDSNKKLITGLFQDSYSMIENSGTIGGDAQNRRVAFKEYLDMETFILDNPNLSENGIPCVLITPKENFTYYVLIKNNIDNTYKHINPYGISSPIKLILESGYSFAVYVLKVGATVEELKQGIILELSYISTKPNELKIDDECTQLDLLSTGTCYLPSQGTVSDSYLIPITEITDYYVKFEGSSDIYTTVANIPNMCGVTLTKENLKTLLWITGIQESINDYSECYLYHNNNEHNGDFVFKIVVKTNDIKYLLLSKGKTFTSDTYPIKIYKGKLHDSVYQNKVKKYGLEIDGDMQRKIKNYNNKYKNYKGMYERLEDGKILHYNQGGYNYPILRNGVAKTTYYNGEKGDFYIYVEEDMKTLDFSQATKGCIVYFDGENLKAEPNPFWVDGNEVFEEHYDVFIAGGGSGAIGTAFALKDLGYKVCMVEKLDCLGGTHSNTAIIGQIPSPVGSWYKDILRASIDSCAITVANTIVTEENIDEMFKNGQVSLNSSQHGKHTVVNPYWYKRYLLDELKGKIDIKLNTEVIDNKEINGKIIYATVRNTKTGITKNVYADYFVDCTADCYLLKANKTLDTDYFLGSDSKVLYNESAYSDGYVGDKYNINAYEVCYYYGNPQYNMLSSDGRNSKYDDLSTYEPIEGVSGAINGSFNIQRGYKCFKSTYGAEFSMTVISPDYNCMIPQNWLIDYGYDYTYNHAEKYAKAHYKAKVGASSTTATFRGKTPLLALREGYRMKCDRMLQQSDIETRVTTDNLVSEHYIALSTWYADSHVPTGVTPSFTASSVNNSWLNGIPYECLIPSCYKNALVACRGFGASHIGASAVRLIRTMMSLGYASGKAIQLCLENKLDDVRDVDITQLQSNIGISDLLTEVNERITELSTT